MSKREAPAVETCKSGRIDAVDCARGLALIGMAAYHLTWDLADFRLVSPLLPFSPPMRLLSHTVASAFLALVGVSLALAHRDRLNLPAFSRRLVIVIAGAALVTAASWILFPGQIIWFGILHCIAAASLLALPFVVPPAWTSILAGAAAIGLPFFFHSALFDPPALLWLGLGEALPNTVDWYPLLPWAGIVLVGLGAARLPRVLGRLTSPWRWRAKFGLARAVSFAGRHSLAVYLLHQAVLYPLVWAIAASGLVATFPPPASGLWRLSVRLRASLRISREGGRGLRIELPMRRRSGRAVWRRRSARRAQRRAEGGTPAHGRRLHGSARIGSPEAGTPPFPEVFS